MKTFYFNTYSPCELSEKEWQADINRHNEAYQAIKNIDFMTLDQFNELVNAGLNLWVTIRNDNPYFNKGTYLVNITLTYINKPVTVYLVKEALQPEVTIEAPTTSEQDNESVNNELNDNKTYYTVCNRPFLTLEDAQTFCLQCDFDYDMIQEVNESTIINEPVKDPIYWHSYRLRGFSPFCQPKGHVKVNHGIGRHGIIAYDRLLTDTELSEYELDPYCEAV